MIDFCDITVSHYAVLGLILFITGISGAIMSKNIIKVLISLVIMFSGITINFATFSAHHYFEANTGGIFALFIIIFTTLQTAVGIALANNIFKFGNSTNTDNIGEFKG